MRFTDEELSQVYDYVAERLLREGLLIDNRRLGPSKESLDQFKKDQEEFTSKLVERIKGNPEGGPVGPHATEGDLTEGISPALRVPSPSVIKQHTLDWTQDGRSL